MKKGLRAIVLYSFLLSLFPFVAVLAPVLEPADPNAIDLALRLTPPSGVRWLGTDDLGRDVLSRLIGGSRVSVAAGVIAVLVALAAGITAGTLAAYHGRAADQSVVFTADVFQATPALVLVAAASSFFPPSFLTAALLIAATSWPEVARSVRSTARDVLKSGFVEAARATGASPVRILVTHVFPHALAPAVAAAPYILAGGIVTEASLSFLGLGTPPPAPSWGRAMADARSVLPEAWWCMVPPALAIVIVVFVTRRLGELLSERWRHNWMWHD